MKKYLMTVVAALAAASFTSCSNEMDMFDPISSEKATIDLNITNDDAVVTRAEQTASKADWWAKMGSTWAKASTLEGKTYTPGDYTIQVGNYQSEADAMEGNSGAGDAYYTLEKEVTLVKGTNTVTFPCGKAKNGKVTVDWSGTAGIAGLAMTSVVAEQTSKSRTYTFTGNGTAYFYAGVDIVSTINYTYNNQPKSIVKTIAKPAAATQYAFNVSANSNGTITTLTITYDDEFGTGGTTSTTIDAATGAEATN